MQFLTDQVGAMFEPLFAPGGIDENLLHGAGRGLEKMPAIGELLVTVTGDLQPGLMHQSRRLKRLSGFLIGHPDGGEFAQFSIDQREQFLGSLSVALLHSVENASDVTHGWVRNRRSERPARHVSARPAWSYSRIRVTTRVAETSLPDNASNHQEWVAACKGGPAAGSNFDRAGPLTEVVLLGNVALRVQPREKLTRVKLKWDPEKFAFPNLTEAGTFLRRDYRSGWSL